MPRKKKNTLITQPVTPAQELATLSPEAQEYLNRRFELMEARFEETLINVLGSAAKQIKSAQAMADLGQLSSGTNHLIDTDTAEEFERRANQAAAYGLDVGDQKITKREFSNLLASGSHIVNKLLGKRG